jgi:aminocarboxymuconate-semialdehyde decarboxylase
MTCVDMHAHYWPAAYLDALAGLGADVGIERGTGAGAGAELAGRLALMDDAGIDVQVLSAAPLLPHLSDAAAASRLARMINDEYAELAARHPGRFRFFAALPFPHVDAALRELARAHDELGAVGVTLSTSILGRSPADDAWAPVFAELDRRGSVLYIHPAGCGAGSPLISPFGLTWMIGAPIEDTVSILHLITAGIPSRYPNMKIINSHLGGALPMVFRRLDDQYRWEAPGTPERPTVAARRMWYDTVGHDHIPALRCAAQTLGADRLVLGTDFPYQNGAAFRRAVGYIRDGLSGEHARMVLSTNAAGLLGLDAGA